jgi:Ca2+-binding RTX toxin-like protein
MSNLYVTTFGSAWAGGYSINSITQGGDGWTYLAGGKSAGQNNVNLVVLAYQDGVLRWEKEFGGPKTSEEFRSVYVRDGYVYAAGGIRDGFTSATHDNQIFPTSKPSNTAEPDLNCASFFVKLDAENGDLALARVLPTIYSGNSVASGIAVDEYENIYVNSGLTLSAGGISETNLYKFNASGSVVWKTSPSEPRLDGAQFSGTEGDILFDSNGNLYTRAGYSLLKITYDNQVLGSYFPITPPNPTFGVNGTYLKDFIFDEKGDAYVVGFESSSLNGTTIVAKIKSLHNKYTSPADEPDFLWIRRFTGSDNTPNSICFDDDKNLVIAGTSSASLNSQSAKGGADGFLVKLNPNNGNILHTTLIGTDKNERISEAIINPDGDTLVAGDFSSKYYSIENTSYKNIYLITKDGFTLVGNALGNEIQGGEGNDKIIAGLGNDKLAGGTGDDFLNGGSGDDILIGGTGSNELDGGAGIDVADFSVFFNKLTIDLKLGRVRGDSTDVLKGIENIIGGKGDDRITGNNASNEITSGAGDDTVDAGGGDDLIVGGAGAGNDIYNGGKGVDTVKYTSAAAAITVDLSLSKGTATSTAGKDAAKIGTDTLSGVENVIAGKYNDIVKGSTVSNVLTGGLGSDSLYGGVDKVRDVFDFNAIAESKVGTTRDKVYDFSKGIDDIDLKTIDADSKVSGNQAFKFTGTKATVNSIWYAVKDVDGSTKTNDIIVYGDVNGDAKADLEIGLVGVTSITATDFVL